MTIKTKLIIIIVLASIASVNAVYLSYDWLFTAPKVDDIYSTLNLGNTGGSFCDINKTFSCSDVINNPLAQFFGMPFTVPAILIYPLIIILSILGYFSKIKNIFKILGGIFIGGLIYNGYYIYQETFNIGTYCPLCLLCTVIIILIGIISISELRKESLINENK